MNIIDQIIGKLPDDADAIFLGFQTTLRGNEIPLYIITAKGHRLFGSTVTENTLRKYDLEIPPVSQELAFEGVHP